MRSWALRDELSLALGQGLVGGACGLSTVCHSESGRCETTELGQQRTGTEEGTRAEGMTESSWRGHSGS